MPPVTGETTWKVFVPYQLLSSPSGYLYGCTDPRHSLVCVTSAHCHQHAGGTSVMGELNSPHSLEKTDETVVQPNLSASVWLHLDVSSGTPRCRLMRQTDSGRTAVRCTCVLFDPRDVLSSCMLTSEVCEQTVGGSVSALVQCLKREGESHGQPDWMGVVEYPPVPHLVSFLCSLMGIFFWLFRRIGTYIETSLERHRYLKMVLSMPEVSRQLTDRYRASVKALSLDTGQPLQKLRFRNACLRQLVDSAVGILILVWMVYTGAALWTAANIMDWADGVARQLEELLHWLKGAPAGLKLNAQLAHFLSHFFLYQLYLWTAYLSLLRPCLGPILHYAMFVGVLGVSFQLCWIQDMVSMLTVHMYCFYVYAARVYSLQVSALSSLWRLFRGKKWNVLRSRVDSVTYDIDQLFVGTLLFTTLLFLLPTVALHYFVFVALRLLLQCVQGAMSWCVFLFNTVPVASLALWLLRSRAVAGNVTFTVLHQHTDSDCVVLYLEVKQLPLSRLKKMSQRVVTESSIQCTWGSLLGQICSGKLIYPWISFVSSPASKSS